MSTLARMHGKPRRRDGTRGEINFRTAKRFGDGRAGYVRHRDDWYVEEEWAVRALIAAEPFQGAVFDPACGCGIIPLLFRAAGFEASGSDKAERGFGTRADFLAGPDVPCDNIVSNPPFKQGVVEPFVLKALRCARFKVALLLRLAFLEGIERYETLWRDGSLRRVLVSRARISMPPGDRAVRAKGGQMAFAWFIWERGWHGAWEGGWI